MNRFLSLGNVARSATTNLMIKVPCRTYIRPHYYNNSLSEAVRQQQNPLKRISRRLNNMDPNKVLWTIIGTNLGVFLVWTYAKNSYSQFGDARWLNFMYRHFTVSEASFDSGRYYTLLTSAFSHNLLPHLGMNMFVLYSMGQGVLEAIGPSRFLLLYAGAGLCASLTTLAYKKYIRPSLERSKYGYHQRGRHEFSLGASGSIMGLTSFFACAFPRATFLVFFIIPMPAFACVGLFAAYDIYLASSLNSGIIDSAAHVGGAAYGLGYWFLRVRPLLKAGRWRV